MKTHSTNYYDCFIAVAEDCPALQSVIPREKGGKPTIASMQYQKLVEKPYHYSSDELIFEIYAERNDITESEREEARKIFFSKGQPCLRASPLPKQYGWGIHSNAEGKVALYGSESDAYKKFVADAEIECVKAMRNGKAK